MLRLIRRPCFPHIRAIVGGAPALQATRATVGGASDLCAAIPAQEGLSQSIRPLVARSDPIQGPLVARSDPIQGSPVAGSHLGGLSQLIELTKPYNALLGCLRVRLILP
jgi:hypothetical protein